MLHECKEVSIIKLRHLVHSTTKGLLFEQQTMTIITMTGHIGPAATGHSITTRPRTWFMPDPSSVTDLSY